jgi:ribosomal protein S11
MLGPALTNNHGCNYMVEANQSYRERQKAARAAASTLREAEWLRQVELRVEVKRLAREAVIYSIRAAGDKVQRYTGLGPHLSSRFFPLS